MAPAIDEALGQDDATVAAAAAAADRLFPIIKPLCVACLDPPVWQVQNASSPLAALRRALEEYLSGRTNGGRNGPDRSDGDCRKGLGILADYVLFPLTKGLGSDNSSIYALENALHVVSVTLGADPSRPVSQSVFMDLLVFLPLLLKDGRVNRRSSGKEHRSTSEEFKLAAISALQSLFHDDDVSATNGDVSTDPAVVIRVRKSAMERRRMVKPEYFAQMISVLLDLSNEERSLQVRLAALDCIQQWIQWVNNPAMVSKFLPGIASALVKVIVNNLNSNHRLITQSCTLLSDIVTLTCGDTRFKEEILPKAPSTLVALAAQSASEPKSSSEADVWLETASTRLHATFATILSHRGHPNPQIRHSFLHLIVKVLEGCAHSLSICLPLLLEALVFYFDDEDASIREECELFFRHVEAFLPSHFDLKRALTDNLGKTLSKIPTALRGVDASSKRTQIRSAIGYLSLMSDSCRPVLSAQMEPFLRAVLSTVKFSSLHFSLIIDRNVEGAFAAIGDVYSRTGSLTSTKEIGNLPDSDSLADFERFLNLFAIYSDKLELLSSLNVQLSTIIDTRPCLFIQNEILRGIRMSVSGQASNSNSKRSLRMPSVKPLSRVEKYALGDVLRTYLSVLEKAMDNNSLDLDDKSLHITEQCLVLEGVGEIALALQRDFEELLIDSLYLIILELGSQSRAVSQAAWHCLCSIALACGHRGDDAVKQLIVSNIDYVVNDVCHRLRYPTENPLTPYVLIASLDVAGPKIVPFLDDTIDEIFDAIDRTAWRNEQLLYSLFRVLDTLAGVLLVSTKN
ncbi:armadillo-type protein [Zopfochytrium polystomum]|nr:armadillo-type protein [Zopfochytrium polystomum]